mgnify:FL=1
MPDKMTSLRGPGLAVIYHPWFKGNPEENRKPGESCFQEQKDVEDGKRPLPSGARFILDLDNEPQGSEPIYWPAWVFRLYDDLGKLRAEQTVTREDTEGTIVDVQAPDRESGVWQRSRGYRGIFIGPVIDFKGRLTVEASVRDSDTIISTGEHEVFPWVSRQ